jgi:hypothetical protein
MYRGVDPRFLDLGNSFKLQLVYRQYPLDMSLGGSSAGLDDTQKSKLLTLPGIEDRSLSLYRIRYPGFSQTAVSWFSQSFHAISTMPPQ